MVVRGGPNPFIRDLIDDIFLVLPSLVGKSEYARNKARANALLSLVCLPCLLLVFNIVVSSFAVCFSLCQVISIEGVAVWFIPDNGGEITMLFHSYLSDRKVQNAAVALNHMEKMVKFLMDAEILKKVELKQLVVTSQAI